MSFFSPLQHGSTQHGMSVIASNAPPDVSPVPTGDTTYLGHIVALDRSAVVGSLEVTVHPVGEGEK
jgi:hypothetical protein